ncbi:MAG: co-chaperone GroES [Bacteroidota bacterium]
MQLHPIGDRVLIKPDPLEEKRGNLIIPLTGKEKPQTGTVVAVGLSCAEPKLKAGVNVMFGKHSGTHITANGEPMVMMREHELFAILSEEEPATLADAIIPSTKL